MEEQMGMLLAVIAVILGAALTYAKTFGPYQEKLTEIAVTSLNIPSRYKPAVNLGLGILLASAVTVVAAVVVANTAVIAAGIVAGVFGSIEAQRIHDTNSALSETEPHSSSTTVSGIEPKERKWMWYI